MYPLQPVYQSIATGAEMLPVAHKLHEGGRLHSAAAICRKILVELPHNGEALHLLGIIEYQTGNSAVARRIFGRLLDIDPLNHAVWSNLGAACLALGDNQQARECFEQALRINPLNADAWNNLGVLFDKEDLHTAKDCFLRAIELNPSSADACNNLALNCKKLQQLQDSIAWYRRSLAINSRQAETFCRLAEVLEQTSAIEEVKEAYAASLDLKPDDGIRLKMETVLPVIPFSTQEIDSVRENLLVKIRQLGQQQLSIPKPLEHARTMFYLAYHGRDDRIYHEQMAGIYRKASPNLTWQAPHVGGKVSGGRIRVGFISRFFYNHTIAKLNIGYVEMLDRSRFHVTVFLIASGNSDGMTHRYAVAADDFVVLTGDLGQMRNRIASQKLNILLYTDIGMEPCSYFLAFSRLAAVQCVTWGHPATSGIDTVDYFISHQDCETPEGSKSYSEKLFCLSPAAACTCYAKPNLPRPARVRDALGVGHGRNLYYCPQPPFKMHPDFDNTLKGILERDRSGVVVMLRGVVPQTEMLLKERLKRSMPSCADRVHFIDPLPFDRYVAMMEQADVVLDTPHFSGGNSSIEGLAVGAPIVTMPSPFLKGRITYAWYRKMGITDCIASSPVEYVDIAVRLATDRQAREDVCQRILGSNELLFDDLTAVRELEEFFERVSST
jgi:predicted O-linked N-acetylglucosamine transferase (SPINDLY family)